MDTTDTEASFDLSFLPFPIEDFLADGNERIIKNISPEEYETLVSYFDSNQVKVRVARLDDDAFIKIPHLPHESPSSSFMSEVKRYNNSRTSDLDIPLMGWGSTNVNLIPGHGSYFVPDFAFGVAPRLHPSPNAVGEIHYRSGLTIREVISKLRRYITHTVDVMISIGIFVFEPEDGRFAAVFVAFQRNLAAPNAQPIPLQNVSFGTGAVDNESSLSLQMEVGMALTGVGAGGPACDGNNEYEVNLPENLLLCLDNFGMTLAIDVGNGMVPVRLFVVQRGITRAFQQMNLL